MTDIENNFNFGTNCLNRIYNSTNIITNISNNNGFLSAMLIISGTIALGCAGMLVRNSIISGRH